ncbi:hypothetical protein C8Q70DRAFT_1013262 [Cubamyces menziesii]|nr:hypothetical protein C8Q70DRAFT_1013262 [Cubamyces menziesii]
MYHQLVSGVTQVIVGALQTMRTYALCYRSRRVLLSLLGLCGVECIICAWAVTKIWQYTASGRAEAVQMGDNIGCDMTMSRLQGRYMAAIWGCILIFDAVVFSLTFARVLKAGKLWHGSLFALLLRDGTIYFGVIFVCHLTNILTCLFAHRVYRGFSVTVTNVIATSMMSRLMLKIRDPKLRGVVYHLPVAGSGGCNTGNSLGRGSSGSSELESGTTTVYWAPTHS